MQFSEKMNIGIHNAVYADHTPFMTYENRQQIINPQENRSHSSWISIVWSLLISPISDGTRQDRSFRSGQIARK